MGRLRHTYAGLTAIFLFASGSSALVGSPACAASPSTDAFVSNIRLQAQVLAQASELATSNAAGDKIRLFADTLKAEQADVLDDLKRDGPSSMLAATGGPSVATGRSVAEGTVDMGVFAPPGGVGVLMPAAAMSLDHLSQAKGDAFDTLYTALARSVLTNLAGFYDTYAKTGDDPALRAIAAHELPLVRADAAALD